MKGALFLHAAPAMHELIVRLGRAAAIWTRHFLICCSRKDTANLSRALTPGAGSQAVVTKHGRWGVVLPVFVGTFRDDLVCCVVIAPLLWMHLQRANAGQE